MKLILLSSVFCLLLGFILGRLAPEEEKSEVLKPVVESRRLKSRPEVARERSADRSGREENFEKLRLQVTALPDDPVSRARWKAWILQLRSEEIYEARGILLARERESQNYEIGQNEGEVGDEMLLLLSRWYELDGEGALAWIRGQKVWTRREALKGEIMTITDGFARDPRRGLELSLDWIKRSMTSDPNHPRVLSSEEFRDLILYQVGHWGADPEAMSEQVDADGGLRIPYVNPGSVAGGGHGVRWGGGGSNGFPVTPGYDRQYSENPAMKAFAEGLVASGRMDLAKALSRDLEGGAKEAFQEVFRSAAEKKGWQEVKREIDAGLVEFSHSQTGAVLDEMILEDRDEALDWYLDLPRDAAVSRAEVIEELINYSDTFQKDVKVDSEDPFSIGKALDHDQA
ncbi:hypothetical protein N9Y81_04395, partial [Akkermansiaceae bacterium]|nr:hypothetical protein [Akkermansiaceae bacterium]